MLEPENHAPKGNYSTKYGGVVWTYYDQDVLLEGCQMVRGLRVRVEFWMRRHDGDWVRDGSHGAAKVVHSVSGEPVFEQNEVKIAGVRATAADFRDMLNAVRDGWRAFIAAHPEILQECLRRRTEARLRCLLSEREGIQALLDYKSEEVRLVEMVLAAEDIEKGWDWARKHWPKSPWG